MTTMISIPLDELTEQVQRLGRAFVRMGMKEHAAKLRLYYFALRHGLTTSAPRYELEVRWSANFVREWMRTLKVAPFETAYEQRAPGSPCPTCHPQSTRPPEVIVECSFPTGARKRCRSCDSVWLEPNAVSNSPP